MADHQQRLGGAQTVAEGDPVAAFQIAFAGGQPGREQMRIGPHPSESRKMLERSPHAGGFQPVCIADDGCADTLRIGVNRPLGDLAAKIEARSWMARGEIGEWSKIDVHPDACQFLAVFFAIGEGAPFDFAVRRVGNHLGERRLRAQRRRHARDDASFLVSADDQWRQSRALAQRLQFGDFGMNGLDAAALDVSCSEENAADQSFFDQNPDGFRVAVADHQMRAKLHGIGAGRGKNLVFAPQESAFLYRGDDQRGDPEQCQSGIGEAAPVPPAPDQAGREQDDRRRKQCRGQWPPQQEQRIAQDPCRE